MKILLVGEYSGFHNNLKDGLLELGNHVVIASRKDGFKSLASDINFDSNFSNKYFDKVDMVRKYLSAVPKLKNFDVLQLINPGIISYESFAFNKLIINQLIKQNDRAFLVGAGEDPIIWKYWNENGENLRYSWIDGVKAENSKNGVIKNVLEDSKFIDWNLELLTKINGYISIMFEYAEPYAVHDINKKTIPIPININKLEYRENIVGNKIKIFHGLNRYGSKGTYYVEKAFEILSKRYPNDLDLRIDGKMSQKDYLDVISKANVIIDQNRSYSLAMNALLSMAQGKVVLGGNEPESCTALNYTYKNPALNITPDVQQIVSQVEWLLENRNLIPKIGYDSRIFVEKEHHYIDVAEKYINFWETH